jgi:transcriptional regulator with XRE-family HTH domain
VVIHPRPLAGLTQAELAARAGVPQPTIARLERPGSNPTVRTLDRVLRAAGHRLEVAAGPALPEVDETLIAARLRLTPAERLASFERDYANVRDLVRNARRIDG